LAHSGAAQPPSGTKREARQPQARDQSMRRGIEDDVLGSNQDHGRQAGWNVPRNAGVHEPLQHPHGQSWTPAAPPVRPSTAPERDQGRDAGRDRGAPRERARRTHERERDGDRGYGRERDRSGDDSRDREDRRRDRKLRRAMETSVKEWEREKSRKKKTGSAAAAIGRIGGLFAMLEELGSVDI